jgi:ribose transport system substrate-binding protein
LPFVQSVSAGIRESASGAGIDLVECDAGWTQEGVLACAQQLAEAGVHGVISFQPFGDLAAEVCAITGDAPTIGLVFDGGPCEVSRFRIDQSESGRIAGDAVGVFAAERWDCDIRAYVSLESSDADPDGRARMQGYRDGYEARCPMPEAVHTLYEADRLVTAQTRVAALLDEVKGKPIVVVGLNEDAILGAMAAAEAAGRRNHLWYSGQLADPSIREVIACDGHYIASVAQFPERFGERLVPTLIEAMEGVAVPSTLDAELELVSAANVHDLFPSTPLCDE